MKISLLKVPSGFTGQWLVITGYEQSRAYPIENFDGALQYAVGYCSNNRYAKLELDYDAIQQIEARYLKPQVV